MGLQKTTQGSISFDQQDIQEWSTYNRAKKVAYLPQDPNALLFAETLTQELQITLDNHRENKAEFEVRINRMLDDLGLSQKAKAYPRDLSVGERQRAALGTVTIIDQPIIILDEPTRGLDYAAKRKIQELLELWKNKGASIFLVTHDVEWAYQFADRVSIMEAGQIIDSGPTRDVLLRNEVFRPQVYELYQTE
jgi:energy-coupling factor transport system ATP-binding protein